MRAGADAGDSLVHDGGSVRHRADDRDAGRDAALDQCRRDGGGDREDGLLGLEDGPDLAEEDGEVLRLDGDHDDRRVRDRLGIRQRRLDAVPFRELGKPLLPPPRGDDLGRLAPARAEQPRDQGLADRPRAEDGEAPLFHERSLGGLRSRDQRRGPSPASM